mgnify:CR=1 FL=1
MFISKTNSSTCQLNVIIFSHNLKKFTVTKSTGVKHYAGEIVSYTGNVVAIGGRDNTKGTVDILEENNWSNSTIPPLTDQLTMFSAITVGANIYVFGGLEWRSTAQSLK